MNRRRLVVLIAAVLAVVLAWASQTRLPGPKALAGDRSDPGKMTAAPAVHVPDTTWAISTDGAAAFGVVADGGQFFAVTVEGDVVAARPSGDIAWRAALDKGSTGQLTLVERCVVAVAAETLTCFDRATGALSWTKPSPGADWAYSRGSDQILVAIAVNGDIHRLRVDDGGTVWTHKGTPAPSPVAALAADGEVVFAATGRDIWTLKAATGQVLWRKRLDSPVFAPPTPLRDSVLIASQSGVVRTFGVRDGNEEQRENVDGSVIAAPLFVDGCVVIGTTKGDLQCRSADDGRAVWTAKVDGPVFALHYVTPANHLLVSHGESVSVIHDGQVTGAREFGAPVSGSCSAIDNVAVCAAWNDQLVAFDPGR